MDYFNQQSERLIFRKATEDDIIVWTDFFDNNDRLRFLGIDITKGKEVLATEWIERQMQRYQDEALGHLVVIEKASGIFIGMGGIILRELTGKREFEIAYSLKKDWWNKGYATEIARHMKQFGKENNIAEKFVSIIHKENFQSMNVARKNGMEALYETEFLGMNVFIFGEPNNE